MGGICYESYLTNVSLPAVIPAFSLFVGNVDIAGGGVFEILIDCRDRNIPVVLS